MAGVGKGYAAAASSLFMDELAEAAQLWCETLGLSDIEAGELLVLIGVEFMKGTYRNDEEDGDEEGGDEEGGDEEGGDEEGDPIALVGSDEGGDADRAADEGGDAGGDAGLDGERDDPGFLVEVGE